MTPFWGHLSGVVTVVLMITFIGIWISTSVLILTLAGDAIEEVLDVDTGVRA